MAVRTILLIAVLVLCSLPVRAAHEMENAPASVAILMFDGVQIIDFAAPYEVFGQARFNVYTVSADGEAVTTAMGLNVNVDRSLDEAPEVDIIMVPGGDVRQVRKDEAILAWIREHSVAADKVLSVCTGSHIVAEANLLDGKRATTFHRAFRNFEKEFPHITLVRDQRWVDNGKIVTSAGLASGVDAALHVVAERLGTRKAKSVALHLEYDWSPDEGFVRGRMADRHLRMPSEDFQFPEGTDIDTVLQIGDENHWEIEYRVNSPWTVEEMLAHVTEKAERDPALTVLNMESPASTGWRYESEQGDQWELRFDAETGDPSDAYIIKLQLERAG